MPEKDSEQYIWKGMDGNHFQVGARIHSCGDARELHEDEKTRWAGVVVDGEDPDSYQGTDYAYEPGEGPMIWVDRDDGEEGSGEDDAWLVAANLVYAPVREVCAKDVNGNYLHIGDRVILLEQSTSDKKICGSIIHWNGGDRWLTVVREDHVDGGGQFSQWAVYPKNVERTRWKTMPGDDTLPDADPFTQVRDPMDYPQDMIDFYHGMLETGVEHFAEHFKKEHNVEFTEEMKERTLDILKQVVPFMSPAEGFVVSQVLRALIMHSHVMNFLTERGIDVHDTESIAEGLHGLLKAGGGLGVDPHNKEEMSNRLSDAAKIEFNMDDDDPADRIMKEFKLSDN